MSDACTEARVSSRVQRDPRDHPELYIRLSLCGGYIIDFLMGKHDGGEKNGRKKKATEKKIATPKPEKKQPDRLISKQHPCCKKIQKLQEILKSVPVYLPPDKLREVRKVLEAPLSDYED